MMAEQRNCRNEACLAPFWPARHTQFYCEPKCTHQARKRRARPVYVEKYRKNPQYRAEHKARVLRLTEAKREAVKAIGRFQQDVRQLAHPHRVGIRTLERTRDALKMLRDFLVEASERDHDE